MKKILLTALLVFTISSVIFSQASRAKLSPLTKKYLKEIKMMNDNQKLIHNYVYKTSGNKTYVSALIKVNSSISETTFNSLGIRIGTKAGNIWTTQIPLENMEAFTQLSGINYIQLDEPALPELFAARAATRVDSVHAGYNLPMPYNGAGVVVGVVDAGFDYGHPAYFDTTGVGYRVKSVWMQKNNTGPAPSGYSYGTELTDSIALWNIGNDDAQTHATHVSGICGGSGFGGPTNEMYRGVAYKSDMVLVGITPDKSQWVSTGESDMIDGINYVFSYANSVSKPAVVNLSWGSPLGPRDGTGLFSQALDNLTGPGKIFVCSAGNSGEDSLHVHKTFTSTDSLVQTFLIISTTPEGKKTWVDIWGDTAKTFCAEVALYHGGQIASTGYICLDDTVHDLFLLGLNNDTCFVSFTTSSSEFNMKPRIFLDFDNRSAIDSICIRVKGTSGSIHFWDSFVSNTSGYYSKFHKFNYPWAVNGDNDISISDLASSRSAITVGAYASKTDWTDVLGSGWTYSGYVLTGNLVPFSSHGPTVDGRIKPDITGPGLTVGSAISSYDSTFTLSSANSNLLLCFYHNPVNSRDYAYGELSGTSMSSPAVSGITALLLQVDGSLSPQDVKDIYTQTAIIDSWTGSIPAGGNSLWGNGKVNAYGAIKKVVQMVGIKNISGSTLHCNLFPNPNSGSFNLDYTGIKNENLKIEIYDIPGHCVHTENWKTDAGYNFKQLDVKNLNAGIYYTKISSANGFSIIKMTVTH